MKDKKWISKKIAKIMAEGKKDRKQAIAIAYSMAGKAKKSVKHYKKVVDNKMRDFGETDLAKGVIKINKSKKKNKKRGDIIDTIVHEENHVKHPKMHERNIRKKTKTDLKRMKATVKKKLYSSYKKIA